MFLVKNEKDVSSEGAVKKIHKILNHKSKEKMYYMRRNAEKLTSYTKRMINQVVDTCNICKEISGSKSKPLVAVSRSTDFDSVVAIDLKVLGYKNILWMIC